MNTALQLIEGTSEQGAVRRILNGSGDGLSKLVRKLDGDRAKQRFFEFFTVNIRNRTRLAYARAIADFLEWCD